MDEVYVFEWFVDCQKMYIKIAPARWRGMGAGYADLAHF